MRTLLFLLLTFPALGQLPSSGSLSIKTSAGSGRSVAQEVDGNTAGNKSLSTLSTSAGKLAPHSLLEFYGYTGIEPSASFDIYNNATNVQVHQPTISGGGSFVFFGAGFPLNPGNTVSGMIEPGGTFTITISGFKPTMAIKRVKIRGSNLVEVCKTAGEGNSMNLQFSNVQCFDTQNAFYSDVIIRVEDGACP